MFDPYVDKESGVLINRKGIKDEDQLNKFEIDSFAIAFKFLKKNPIRIVSLFDCLHLHKILFSNVYEWAGKIRTINIYKAEAILENKSIDYVLAHYINIALNQLDKEYKSVKWETLDNEEKIQKIVYFISEFWHIHPFREGNTRTTAVFLYLLVKQCRIHINTHFLSKNSYYFRNALVLNCLYNSSKPNYIIGIIKDSISLKGTVEHKYINIEGINVKKYTYTNHTIKRLETIKKPSDWDKK